MGELTRENAMQIAEEDKKNPLPANYEEILSTLSLSAENIDDIAKIPANVFANTQSTANRIFAIARFILKKNRS